MSGPEFNPQDDEPIDREEWEKAMRSESAPPTIEPSSQPAGTETGVRCKDCGEILDKHSEPIWNGYCKHCDPREPIPHRCEMGGEIVILKPGGDYACLTPGHGGSKMFPQPVAPPTIETREQTPSFNDGILAAANRLGELMLHSPKQERELLVNAILALRNGKL